MGKRLSGLRQRWSSVYRRTSIQMILSASFTAVAVLGMLFMGLTLFLRFSSSTNAQQSAASQRVLSQVNVSLDGYLRSMMRISDAAYYQLIKDTDLAEDDLSGVLDLLYESSRDSLVSIAVFSAEGDLIAASPMAPLKNSVSPEREEWFCSAMDRIENLHFSTPHVQNLFEDPDYRYRWVVSLSRFVELTRGGAIEGGVLLVDMSFSGIEQICKDVELSDSGGYLYLIDDSGEIIYHPRQQLIYAGLLEENNLDAASYADGVHSETFQGQRRQVAVKTVGYTGWKLVGVVPAENLWSNYGQLVLFFLFIVTRGISVSSTESVTPGSDTLYSFESSSWRAEAIESAMSLFSTVMTADADDGITLCLVPPSIDAIETEGSLLRYLARIFIALPLSFPISLPLWPPRSPDTETLRGVPSAASVLYFIVA